MNKQARIVVGLLTPFLIVTAAIGEVGSTQHKGNILEEITITAQKREQSLQDIPIAASVVGKDQLEVLGLSGLDDFRNGVVPSLRVQFFGNTPSTLNIAIRGNAPTDVGQITRDYPVAIYLDGIYLSRAQGLGVDIADLEQIEILRGPQGTLFGKNATGGAVNLVSSKPTGKLGVKQNLSFGKYNELTSASHVNLPSLGGLNVKIDHIYSERDGWVENSAPGASDYNEYEKQSSRLSLSYQVSDDFQIDYSYDYVDTDTVHSYFQLYSDSIGILPKESGRQMKTRFPISPLEPTKTTQKGNTLTFTWKTSESLTIKSLSGYRDLKEDGNNNYAGIFYFNGLYFKEDIDQDQFSQEFQFIGTNKNVEWIAGLYYFDENANNYQQNIFTLDSFGCYNGIPNTLIQPTTLFRTLVPTDTGVECQLVSDQMPQIVDVKSKSTALYGQATWTPSAIEKMDMTAGFRYTKDEKSGSRSQNDFHQFEDSWDHNDYLLALNYSWADNISTYLKWSTAYKAGGVSLRSTSFSPFDEEESEALEVGFKSQFFDNRLRLNAALFATDYHNMQIDFADPSNITIVETINAAKKVEVDGIELELTVAPFEGLLLGVNYTYLDGDMPLQPNPLSSEGALSRFELAQTPEHAGSLTVDYTVASLPLGNLVAHLDISSTDHYSYLPLSSGRFDAYTLFNARLSLSDIKVGADSGSFRLSVWGRNITDEEYIVYSSPVGTPPIAITEVYGDPRTIGININYEF
jgi:iron complex outermembrane receptor protein